MPPGQSSAKEPRELFESCAGVHPAERHLQVAPGLAFQRLPRPPGPLLLLCRRRCRSGQGDRGGPPQGVLLRRHQPVGRQRRGHARPVGVPGACLPLSVLPLLACVWSSILLAHRALHISMVCQCRRPYAACLSREKKPIVLQQACRLIRVFWWQVGPCTGIDGPDQLWMSRYILIRLAELYNIEASLQRR